MSRILDWLYLGGKKDAKNMELLQELGVKRVLNVTPCVCN